MSSTKSREKLLLIIRDFFSNPRFVFKLLAVDCGPLYSPMNGSAFGDSTVFPNSVLFKCDPGFLLTGSSKRTCQPNGTWNGLKTMCVGRFKIRQIFRSLV